MKDWHLRPSEIANLLNPAFCGEVISRGARSYETECGKTLPFALTFLVLPIVLHKPTREQLNPRTKQMHVWLQSNGPLCIGFADRVRAMKAITQEAVVFLHDQGRITIDDVGGLRVTGNNARENQFGGEVRDCLKAATVVGRLMARAGPPTAVWAMWGVRP